MCAYRRVHMCLPCRVREKQSVPSTDNVYTDRLQPSCVAFGAPGIPIYSCRYSAWRYVYAVRAVLSFSLSLSLSLSLVVEFPVRHVSTSSLCLVGIQQLISRLPVTHASRIANCRVINSTRVAVAARHSPKIRCEQNGRL